MSIANIRDLVLLWIHCPRLGITSDGESTQTSAALVVDGVVVASTRKDIIVTALGHNGIGAVTIAGAVIGDNVLNVTNITTPGDVTTDFETSVSVTGQVQQTNAANLSAAQLMFQLGPQS